MTKNRTKKSACRLCGTVSELQESHIIPGFVYKWLKSSSGNGYLRFGQQPNKRSQDGYKAHWLCMDCEQRFSKWETQFSNQVFHPMIQGKTDHVQYGSWLLPFCVSVSWRVLNLLMEHGHNLPKQFQKNLDRAEIAWRGFLLNKRPHPGKYEQHFIPFDVIQSYKVPNMPVNMNRYILRAVEIDAPHSEERAYIFSKLGRFVILGFIDEPLLWQWKGTKIHANKGVIKPKTYTLPIQFGKYLKERATRVKELQGKISNNQKKKIEESFLKDPSRFSKSEFFHALNQDVRLFGEAALKNKE